MREFDCFRDCDAACCRGNIQFHALLPEQLFAIRQAKGIIDDSLRMVGPCVFLKRKKCVVYEQDIRPIACDLMIPGDDDCLAHRRRMGYKDFTPQG